MFDQMKAMGAMAGLLRDKQRMREIGERIQSTLETVRVGGEAGGGAVRVTVTGKLEVDSVVIDPAILSAGEAGRDLAQNLIAEAVNDANRKARVIIEKEMRRVSEDLGLPDIPGLGSLLGSGG